MRIVYYAPSESIPAPHAGFVHLYEIVSSLIKLGNDVKVYANSPSGYLSSARYKNLWIEYVNFPHDYSTKFLYLNKVMEIPAYWKSHKKISRDIKTADVLHERFAVPEFFGKFYSKRYKVPLVLEVNGPYVEEAYHDSFFRIFAERNRTSQFKAAKAMITQTDTLKKIIESKTNTPVFVIPNGVNVEFFQRNKDVTGIRDNYGIKDDDIVVTYIGAFKPWHGVNLIPKIVKGVDADVKFLLVGGGPLLQGIKQKLKNEKRAIFTGPQEYENIPKFLSLSDICIAPFDTRLYPPLKELGFWWNPVKLFEYMGAGKPIVSFNFEEVRKIVREGGLLAEEGNIEDFVKKLQYLVENGKERKRLGMAGKKIAEREYDWEIRAKETLKVYGEL